MTDITEQIAELEHELRAVAAERDQLAAERAGIIKRTREQGTLLSRGTRKEMARRSIAIGHELVRLVGRGAELTKALTLARRALSPSPTTTGD